jgi:hypothetical protein
MIGCEFPGQTGEIGPEKNKALGPRPMGILERPGQLLGLEQILGHVHGSVCTAWVFCSCGLLQSGC